MNTLNKESVVMWLMNTLSTMACSVQTHSYSWANIVSKYISSGEEYRIVDECDCPSTPSSVGFTCSEGVTEKREMMRVRE